MKNYKILIVEDEVIIADTIKRYLTQNGHQVVGNAISYQEAESIYIEKKPDLVLLDIRLSGTKTGIDVAYFIQQQTDPKPFIFLSSQLDSRSLNSAKETFPAGYLSKPIQKNTLPIHPSRSYLCKCAYEKLWTDSAKRFTQGGIRIASV